MSELAGTVYGRCDRCRRVVTDCIWPRPDPRRYAYPAADFNASHQFCEDCLEAEEIEQAKELGEWPDELIEE